MYLKFINTEHIDCVLKGGTLIVSSFQHFRDLETTKGRGIGDRLEAATELTAPDKFTLREGSAELKRVNEATAGMGLFTGKFADVSSGGTIVMDGSRFIAQVEPMHIYSFAAGDLDELTRRMCVECTPPYDACLRIIDPGALAQAICDTGVTTDGRPFRALFQMIRHEPVKYEPVTQDIMSGNAIAPSPFRKAPHFAYQSEERFVLAPVPGVALSDRIEIRLPNPFAHFEEVFRGFKP
jgi:hypothetical protein